MEGGAGDAPPPETIEAVAAPVEASKPKASEGAGRAEGERKQTSTPSEPKREAFVFQADTYIGKTIAEYLKEKSFNVNGTVNVLSGGKKKPSYLTRAFQIPLSPTVKPNHVDQSRALSRSMSNKTGKDEEQAMATILECELIVCPLVKQPNLVTQLLTALSALSEEERSKKVVIGITSPLTWAKTPAPFKTHEGPLLLSEGDEPRRGGAAAYRSTIAAERLLLRARDHLDTKGLRTYVVCPGVLYGNGETEEGFLEIFKTAWESKVKLPVFGGGQQYVPTLHVAKLAKYVYTLGKTAPPQHYVLAVDEEPQTLEALLKGIAEAFLTEVEEVPFEQLILRQGIGQYMVDLPMKPTALDVPPNNVYKVDGILPNLKSLRRNFIRARNLHPMRVLLHGPPLSSKSYLGEVIARQYTLPHITAKHLVEVVLPQQSEEFRAEVEARRVPADEATQNAAKTAGAAKTASRPGTPATNAGALPPPGVNVGPRVCDADMLELCRRALASGPCAHLGYVLDGFP
eukprot:CAMPEP_0118926514 /NCGR_PEP_ID=MMETSP1169-20130426/4185_1 /TAXON_ID=36882 /ORGANISM="Pyramimonas obovata, Strain CCMP722" /LENGTH=514 /DNA_ID=CAMNT_0006868075 /DNA_START=143 /DNA_END=1683 /DNA_ORIENTATION=-